MIQTSATLAPAVGVDLRMWGLSAQQLHDAYWHAHGVQCVRRGRQERLQSGADLFLLIEPDQLVLFDVLAIAEGLAWRAANVTRLRVVGEDDEPYGEQVELDGQEVVMRIARRYRPSAQAAYRVLLTRRRRIAKAWMAAEVRRAGWRRIRRLAGASHIDSRRYPGHCFSARRPEDQAALLGRLVEIWRHPDRAIENIRQLRSGVWGHRDASLADDRIVVGPAWIGATSDSAAHDCLIGPAWIPDDPAATESNFAAKLRPIWQIDPAAPRGDDDLPAPAAALPYALAKRTLDVAFSGVGLLAALPILMAIALCILIEDGRPVFFGQKRQARGGKMFRCWKFRTMCRDADAIKRQLSSQNVCDGPQFYVKDDPRVTRIGKVLRTYHLDELPQLWNVLVGQMSLVGPRPSPEDENQICPAWREARLSIRPGLTGLWQLKRTRRPGTDFQEWIRYDLEYLEHASFWFDLKLLFRTLWAIVGRMKRAMG